MSRISLVEAYDNRDVIGQLVRLREDVNELQNILKDIDPDGDLTNVVTKTGDQVIDGIKTFVGKIVADCDIIQNGAAYETHAEQVYSKNDYIVMRDDAIAGLAPGTYSGLHVRKYNGVDDARLVVDNEGVARVGDVNDEQPLLTRDEVADMTSGNILSWDGVNKKAITSGKSVSDLSSDIAAKVSGTGDIGDDDTPVKVVNGEAVPISGNVIKQIAADTFNTEVFGYGLIINGEMYVNIPYNLPGRRLDRFVGRIICRNASVDIGTVASITVNFGRNGLGTAYANGVALPGFSGTFSDVTFQLTGDWTIS